MENVKKIAMVRHGEKDGELIAPAQLLEIMENGVASLNPLLASANSIIVHWGSGLERTGQCALALVRYILEKKTRAILSSLQKDDRFGSTALFDGWKKDGQLMAAQKANNSWLKAFQEVRPDALKIIQAELISALTDLFDKMGNGELLISFGHTPMIEFLAFALDPGGRIGREIVLKELTGFVFEKRGRIITVAAQTR